MSDGNLLVRAEARNIIPYNAGLTIAEVTARYNPVHISKLGSNENPLGPAPEVVLAIKESISAVNLYPDPGGRVLRAELARKHGVEPAQIVLGNGSEDLIGVVCRTVLRPGDQMVTLYPSFPLHEDYTTLMGATVNRIELRPDLTIDADALAEAISSGPRMVMFANPMNPVGAWLSGKELRKAISALPQHTLLVIDEAYADYAAGQDYPFAAELLGETHANWVVLRTFSKAWGLAGLRIGYAVVGDPEMAAYFDTVRTPFNTNGIAQVAALAALRNGYHVSGVVSLALQERERVRDGLMAAGFRTAPSKTNFLFMDTRSDSAEFSEKLLSQGIIVKPWRQEGYQTFIRVSMGAPHDNNHFLQAVRDG